jgi:nucleotide-binding universal stress UspA family protein
MKEILVATDFSKGASRALEYAINLANLTRSNITVIYVDDSLSHGLAVPSESSDNREEAKNNYAELMQQYKDRLVSGKFSFKIKKGKVYQELEVVAKQINCDLIITGTHGQSGYEEYWIGSNAFRVVSHAPCPVITVRSNFDVNRTISNILVPIDNTPETLNKIKFVSEFAQILGARVHIFALNSSKLHSLKQVVADSVKKAEKAFAEKNVSYTIEEKLVGNITTDIVDQAKKVNADLIAIRTEGENVASSILLGQFCHQLINFAPVPILSVHPR